eukprot:GHVR01090880.1.p1 GENE.GHVR01090880.1~~GHVR01090880.1.p1  ORF type:complete len:208 (-),score=44.72 GHVR01090880.1:579-1202(-)
MDESSYKKVIDALNEMAELAYRQGRTHIDRDIHRDPNTNIPKQARGRRKIRIIKSPRKAVNDAMSSYYRIVTDWTDGPPVVLYESPHASRSPTQSPTSHRSSPTRGIQKGDTGTHTHREIDTPTEMYTHIGMHTHTLSGITKGSERQKENNFNCYDSLPIRYNNDNSYIPSSTPIHTHTFGTGGHTKEDNVFDYDPPQSFDLLWGRL